MGNLKGPSLDFLYDQGSFTQWAVELPAVPAIRIKPRKHWNNQWLWFAFRTHDWHGKTPHFLIAKADRYSVPAANENMAVWSVAPDTDTWIKFDNQTIGLTDIEFYHNTAFPAGEIYIAYLPMYPFSRITRKIAAWAAADARIVDTPSTAGFVISNSTARDAGDGRGRLVPALPFYGFLLTNASGFVKNNMILTAGNHPSETTGLYELEGAITWLLGGSAQAEFLLDWFNVFVYPCTNPQGVWSGYFRSCPENTTFDHNRYWNVDTLECIHAFRDAMTTDAAAVEVGVDFHSSALADTVYGSCQDNTHALSVVFATKMTALEPTFDLRTGASAGMLDKLWIDSYAAKLSLAIEAGALNTQTLTQVKAYGSNTLKALTTMHTEGRFTNGPGVGSRDFNGTTDRIDWANFYDPAGAPISISAWIYSDGNADANSDYLCLIQDAGDASTGTLFYTRSSVVGQCKSIGFTINGATDLLRLMDEVANFAGAWHHVLVTFDGTFIDATRVHLYLDGIEAASYGVTTNGVAETAHTGTFCIGGRTYDDARNYNGKIAQVGVWNRVLSAPEIANLAAGYAPDLAAAADLLYYFKGNTASLTAVPGGLGTADGTASITGVGNGPSIIYG